MSRLLNKKISLKLYLNIVFVVSIVITVFAAAGILVHVNINNSREHILEGDRWLVSQLCENADYLSQQADKLSANMAFDSDIQSALIAYEYGQKPSLEQVRIRINQNLVDKSQFNAALYDCVNAVIFSNNGEVIGSKSSFNQRANAKEYDWFSQVEHSNGQSIWLPIGYDKNGSEMSKIPTIPIVRKIYSTQSASHNKLDEIMTVGKELGYVMVYINLDMFSDLIADDVGMYSKKFFLTDSNHTVISCKNKDEIGRPLQLDTLRNGYCVYDGEQYLITQSSMKNREWQYLCLTGRAEVNRDAALAINVCITICSILILVFSFVGIHISRHIGKPVALLEYYFKKAKSGNVFIAEKTDIQEFSHLFLEFNNTMTQIHDLANEVYKNKLTQQELVTAAKESQIQALRMQINPHFLYNTLDCISWKAQMDGNPSVAEMIQILGQFFRSNTNIKSEFTTLGDEIKNIELYISLSLLRFGSRLHCFIDIDKALYPYTVIKLLLQPFVENSIKHGLEAENQSENIWIWAGLEDGELVVSIKDDGGGMDTDKLDSLQSLWRNMDQGYVQTATIGVYNAMRRLYLCYRDACRFEMFSEKGVGTEVVITFPARLAETGMEKQE